MMYTANRPLLIAILDSKCVHDTLSRTVVKVSVCPGSQNKKLVCARLSFSIDTALFVVLSTINLDVCARRCV